MTITSISGFLEKCFSNPLLKDDEKTIFYRGANQIKETPHIPSLYYPPNNFYEKEHLIFNETVSLFPDEISVQQKLTVEKLILMQHFRFPTRIMDISKNPLIGLFFSCFADRGQEKSLEKDGIVYVYAVSNYAIFYYDNDTVTILVNLCKLTNEEKRIDSSLSDRAFNEQPTIKRLLHCIRQDKPDFANHIDPGDTEEVVCLRPQMNSPRIIRQDGYFFLFGFKDEKKNYAKMKADWILDPVVIPAKSKKEILFQLDKMDINVGFVYPEMERVNEAMRERYGKKQR